MTFKILPFAVLLFFFDLVQAQSNYSQTNFRIAQGTYADISASGAAISMTDNVSGVSTAPQNIGFDFNFNGTVFTQFMIHADGIMRLGTAAPGAATDIAASPAVSHGDVFINTTASFQNVILPFFTNLIAGSSAPQFHVLTSGVAPNRVCTIQWKNLRDANNVSGGTQFQFDNLEFQAKLYEGTNDIEFIYGPWIPSATALNTRNAASGIKATNTSFLALYRGFGNTPFHKIACLNAGNNTRITNGLPFRKDLVPGAGLSTRFFGAVTNDVGVAKIFFDSLSPVGTQDPGRIEALIRNEGTNAMTNVAVTLNISGANTHNAVVNIPNLAAGALQNVTFPSFTLNNKGQQTILVTVAAAGDTRTANNSMSAKHVISQSQTQVYDIANSATGVGFTSTGFAATKIYGTGTRKIHQVRIPFGSYRNLVKVLIYEDGGTNGAPSSAPLASGSSDNFLTTNENTLVIPFNGVTVSGNYYVVVNQLTTANMVWRVTVDPVTRLSRSYTSATGIGWGVHNETTPWQYLAEIYEETSGPDVGIEKLTAPVCGYSTNADVKVAIRNFSANAIDFSATPATISGFVRNPQFVEVPFTFNKNSGNLAAGASEEVTVLTGYDYTPRGYHLFTARTNLAGDLEPGNDSLRFFIGNQVPVTRSITTPVCPLTEVTLTGPAYLSNLLWNRNGTVSGGATLLMKPTQTTIVRVSGTDYRGCLLQDSVIVEVKTTDLPPKPVLLFGDTVLSHRNAFKDTVRVKKLDGHTIAWQGGIGTVASDSAFIVNQIVGLNNQKVAAAYTRISDGCSNLSDTIAYKYIAGVLLNNNDPLTTCDTAFYDSGGPLNNTGSSFTRSFTPSTPGTKMKLTFYRLDLAQFAILSVHDGPTISSPRIEAITSTSNGNTVREYISSNQDGILTVRFQSGSSGFQGWWAGLNCYTPEIYRTVENGNWISPSTWERKSPGGSYTPAVRPPVKADDSVYIRHNITLGSSTPMDQIMVEAAGIFNIENPGQNFISMPAYKTLPQPEFLVKGVMNISEKVQVFGTNGQMIVQGRLNNFGQIDFDSVVFNGTTPQILGNFSGSGGSMRILRLDNPAGLTLGSDQTIRGVHFVNGIIKTDSENLLTITNSGGFITGASNTAHVDGPVQLNIGNAIGTRLFPIGKNGLYRPVMVNNTNSNTETSDAITVELIPGAPASRTFPATIDAVSSVRYYRITRIGNSGLDFRVVLPYGTDDGVSDPAGLTIAKDNGAGAWLDIGGTASGATPGTIQSGLFNGFSDFVLANKLGGNNALPVTWVSFVATPVNGDALLQWRTGSEANCKFYEVQRSANGSQFSTVTSLGCRNSSSGFDYSYTDKNPGSGTWYYRLRQVDADGSFSYSAVRQVTLKGSGTITMYPNPASQRVTVAGLPPGSRVTLYDAAGRPVLSQNIAAPAIQLSVQHLASGVYYLLVEKDGQRHRYPLQVIR